MRHRVHRPILFVAVISAGLALTTVCVFGHEGHGGKEVGAFDLDAPRHLSPETAAHIGLKTAEIDFGAVEDVLPLSGIVRAAPDRHWIIATRTAGKVLSVRVQVGDPVKKGDLLIEVDSPELAKNVYEARKLEVEYQRLSLELIRGEGRVEQLRVEVENSEATAKLVEAELARLESTGEKAVTLNELADRRAAALKARGDAKLRVVDLTISIREAELLRHQAEALRLSRDALLAVANVESTEQAAVTQPADDRSINIVRLLSPADGVVVERSARPGHWTTPGETLLAVADFNDIQIEGELPESLIARVTGRSSDVVRISTPSDASFQAEGKIKFVSPVLDPIKRTAHVVIEAPNPELTLREGMFVDLTIVLRQTQEGVVVPVSAVVQDGPMHFVFLKSGEIYKKQDINPGVRDDRFVEVLAGLAPGDVVVTDGAYSLTQLRPKTGAAIAAAPPIPSAGH